MPFSRIIVTTILIISSFCSGGSVPGKIIGAVSDAGTGELLIAANIIIPGTTCGASTDNDGNFAIFPVEPGAYSLKITYLGFQECILTDIIVRPGRITAVNAELYPAVLDLPEITVNAGYFRKAEKDISGSVNFSAEEVRRAPGSAGDVSRIVMGLPSVAKVNDQSNSLIVRGGSPLENIFIIDNIEVPNINHFPTQGSSGGPIGMVNADFIRDVDFSTGGFGAMHGNRLSSVMEITFREGNRSEFDGQLDLNFGGLGGVFEAPINKGKGYWIFSARRSYLDMLVDAFDAGTSVAPLYSDYQVKIGYDINPQNKVHFFYLRGDDYNNPDQETAIKNDMQYYGYQDISETTAGINWKKLWQKRGYSNTSLSRNTSTFDEDFFVTNTGLPVLRNRSEENRLNLRNSNRIKVNSTNFVDFGLEAHYSWNDYNNYYGENTNELGVVIPGFLLKDKPDATEAGTYLSWEFHPSEKMILVTGLRGDYFSFNREFNLSPRLSMKFNINQKSSFSFSSGLYYQNLPLLFLTRNNKTVKEKTPQSIHIVMGFQHLLTSDTRLTIEAYHKDYRNFPVDQSQPGLFIIDEIFYSYGFYQSHEKVELSGKALSYGIETMVQKKLVTGIYGMFSAAWSRSEYKGGDGIRRNRIFDNRWLLNAEGGFKPDNNWEMSLRWTFAGGAPYTPLDEEKSRLAHNAVLDEGRINQARYPDYHSLNLRIDRRFNFRNSNLVFYLSVWNVYNRENTATYYWNENEQKIDSINQWSILPIFGLEYEF